MVYQTRMGGDEYTAIIELKDNPNGVHKASTHACAVCLLKPVNRSRDGKLVTEKHNYEDTGEYLLSWLS